MSRRLLALALAACVTGAGLAAPARAARHRASPRPAPAAPVPLRYLHAAAEAFGLPDQEVLVAREQAGRQVKATRPITDEEIPVICFIAAQAEVDTARVVALRHAGSAWAAAARRLGVGPEAFFVPAPLAALVNTPYMVLGRPRAGWRSVVLSDPDVVNLVNLRMLMVARKMPPERVIAARAAGRSFLLIEAEGAAAAVRARARASAAPSPEPPADPAIDPAIDPLEE